MRENDCRDSSKADAKSKFFPPERVAISIKSMINGSRDFSNKNLDHRYDHNSDKFKFSNKGWKKWVLEGSGDGPMSK